MITREEFSVIYQQGEEAAYELLRQMFDKVLHVEEHLHQLEVKVNKNSQNSSKPPSSDGFKRPPRNLRIKTNKKSGGQPGHQGKTLEMTEHRDTIEVHSPSGCSQCGCHLEEVAPSKIVEAQIHDLPPLRLHVAAHLKHYKICPCCQHEEAGEFPQGMRSGAQYGSTLKGLAVYMQYGQFIPSDRTAQFFREVFHAEVSEGSLLNFLSEASQRLEPVEEKIKEKLLEQPVLRFDETGMRISSKLHWVHVVSNDLLTFYAPHKKRGKAAIEDIAILPSYKGVAIHDCWASYLNYDVRHGLCNVHICRELKGLYEDKPQGWIQRLLRLLFGLKRRVDCAKAAGRIDFSFEELTLYETLYKRIVALGQSQNAIAASTGKRGKPKQSKAYNLLKRLDVNRVSVLRFVFDFRVPFDNNLAERDIRMVKLRQKISGCFRSEAGAAMFCRIRGFISTLRKQSQPLLSEIVNVFSQRNYIPQMGC